MTGMRMRCVTIFVLFSFVFAQVAPAFADDDAYARGVSFYLKHNYPEAIQSFREYLKAHPQHTSSKEWIDVLQGLQTSKSLSQFDVEASDSQGSVLKPGEIALKQTENNL